MPHVLPLTPEQLSGILEPSAADVRVLSYNLVSRGRFAGDTLVSTRWNSSTVYARIGGKWKILHSHWSFTAP